MSDSVKYTYDLDLGWGSGGVMKRKGSLEHLPDLFCPNCGAKDVYVDNANDDYYSGPLHICFKCLRSFYHGNSGMVKNLQETK